MRFWTESVALCCSDPAAEKRWWIESFSCEETKVPEDWDCTLPADVALKLPGNDEPAILLSDRAEVRDAGYERSNERTIIFCAKLAKAHEWLRARGADAGPIQQPATQSIDVAIDLLLIDSNHPALV